MPNPKVILFCCNSTFGVENFRGGIIRALVAAGERVVVVAPRDEYVLSLQALGAEYVEWDLRGHGTSIHLELLALWRLLTIYRRVKPTIAYHFTIKPVIYGAMIARFLGIPFVSVITGLGYAFLNADWVSRVAVVLYRATLRLSCEVWLLNEDDRDAMERQHLLRGVKVRMLCGEGVDTKKFQPRDVADSEGFQFLMIARLLRDKGVLEFVEAARTLRHEGSSAQFAILGAVDTANLSAISRDEVAAWEAEGIVAYLGTALDVRPHIADAQCVVLPSYREGVPRSLLEAAAMGKPLITTDVPGCRNVVIDGETGYLCRVKDASNLADAMRRLLALAPALRREMGRRGREMVVENFDERLVLSHYYDSLRTVRS